MNIKVLQILKGLLLTICFYVVSCATITVNVYFPAEEVRDAYSSLEDEFLQQPDEQEAENKENTGGEKAVPTPKPQSRQIYPDKPLVSERKVLVLKRELSLDFTNYALAQGNIASQIAEKIRAMPDVVDAYKRRAQRQTVVNQMLSQGKVSEGSEGLLIRKTALSASEQNAFNAENKDRGIIIDGMVRAILAINNISATPENIEKVRPEAARQFAAFRRSER